MATKKNAPASRGFVNNTILECLLDGDKYGYDIIKQVKDKTNGKVVLKEPSLYSSLKRFELKGYITSYWGNSDIGGRRHYYSLTEVGRNYFNSLHLPKTDLKDILTKKDEETEVENTSQVSLDLSEDMYDLDEDNTEINDAYINNMTFDVQNKIDELLSPATTSKEEKVSKIKDNNVDQTLNSEVNKQDNKNKNDVENNFDESVLNTKDTKKTNTSILNQPEKLESKASEDTSFKEDDEELVEEIYEQIENTSDDTNQEKTSKDIVENENENDSVTDNYMSEHVFRKDNVKKYNTGNEKFVQYDLFKEEKKENYIDSPSLKPIVMEEEKEEVVANQSTTEIKKDIPLIKEAEVNFFNWNELKRKVSNNKSYSLNNVKASGISVALPNNLVEPNTQVNNYNNDKKEIKSAQQNESREVVKPSKIFDNVKERLELKDPVLAPKKQKPQPYIDEPQLSDEEIEILNKHFEEKFEYVAQSKPYQKDRDLDYKKILGELYHEEDLKENTSYSMENEEDSSEYYPEYEEQVEPSDYTQEEDIDDEQVISAINKSRTYNFNNLQKNLSEEGFKFKPYSTEKTLQTEQYVRINKVKLIYATLLSLFILIQTAALFFILRAKDLINAYDYSLYIVSVVLSIGIFVYYLIQYMLHKDERKMKYYNLSFHIMFGILYLFIGLILTYAINLIIGLNNANTLLFISRLLLPAILLTNFIFAPIIYKITLDNTKK